MFKHDFLISNCCQTHAIVRRCLCVREEWRERHAAEIRSSFFLLGHLTRRSIHSVLRHILNTTGCEVSAHWEWKSFVSVCVFCRREPPHPATDPNLSSPWSRHVNHPKAAVNKCSFYGLYISMPCEWKQMPSDRLEEPFSWVLSLFRVSSCLPLRDIILKGNWNWCGVLTRALHPPWEQTSDVHGVPCLGSWYHRNIFLLLGGGH